MYTKDDCFTEYYERFDDVFPSMQLGLDEDICKECLEKNKNVYELGYAELDEDKNY